MGTHHMFCGEIRKISAFFGSVDMETSFFYSLRDLHYRC